MPPADDRRTLPWRALVTLAVLALVAAALALVAARGTRERVAANERRDALAVLHSVLPAETHDNDLLADVVEVVDPELLGSPQPHRVYRARMGGAPAGVVMEVTARGGYGGPLQLLVGIRADGSVSAVRVTAHDETPGIGDGVAQRDWLSQFDGHSLTDPPPDDWLVQPDGGAFDAMTGATISPRAVVKGVHNALLYYQRHREDLYHRPPAGAPPAR
jgi:Na+-translocating ferredoxin:NAD+ oxidoreductase subunit G